MEATEAMRTRVAKPDGEREKKGDGGDIGVTREYHAALSLDLVMGTNTILIHHDWHGMLRTVSRSTRNWAHYPHQQGKQHLSVICSGTVQTRCTMAVLEARQSTRISLKQGKGGSTPDIVHALTTLM